MGRRLFRPARVYETVQRNLAIKRLPHLEEVPPPWLKAVESIPPTEILTRPYPIQHQPPNPRARKPRRTFRPTQITYEEDGLRRSFFKDHPWELARPRIMVETDGKDGRYVDWSRGLRQPGLPLTGESLVQRQLWLMHNVPGTTKEQAYDTVRKEFYALRQEEEVETRIAQEEARMVGAYFGKTRLERGMKLEDGEYNRWLKWATSQIASIEAERSQAYASFGNEDAAPADEKAVVGEDAEKLVE